jgi:hypothetical protein
VPAAVSRPVTPWEKKASILLRAISSIGTSGFLFFEITET